MLKTFIKIISLFLLKRVDYKKPWYIEILIIKINW